MRPARWIYRLAGLWGLLVVTPLWFTEHRFGQDHPPAVTHPELYYGFVAVTFAWQWAFLLIGHDPARYRPLMPVTWLEKFPYCVISVVLSAQGRLDGQLLAAGIIDGVLGVAFVVAFVTTARRPEDVAPRSLNIV